MSEKHDLNYLARLGEPHGPEEIAVPAMRTLREVFQRPVPAALDDDLEAGGRLVWVPRIFWDEPDASKVRRPYRDG